MDHFHDEISTIKEILIDAGQGMSITEIARAMKKNNHSVGRYLDNLLVSGQVEMRTYGKAKVFTLSTRVPLDTMMGFADDLILVLDRDSRIVRINSQVLTFFKKTRTDFIGKNIRFLTFNESWIRLFFERIASSLESETPDEEIVVPGKEERTFRKKVIPTVFEDGNQGITILLEDITGKKQVDNALRASEERFRLMAENIQDGITIWEDKKIVYMSHRAEAILGSTMDELSSQKPIDLAIPQERERLRKIISDSKESKSIPSDIMFWIERKDGSRKFILNRITSVRHPAGVTCYIITTDLTEWKHTHDALENQVGFLQHMINIYPNPLFYLDIEGRFLGCNTAFCSLIGKTSDDIVGRTMGNLMGNAQAGIFHAHDDEFKYDVDGKPCTVFFTRDDGSSMNLKIQKSRLALTDGKMAGTVGLVVCVENLDVTSNL